MSGLLASSLHHQACAIVLAAGLGLRARKPGQTPTAKQFESLDDKPLLAWSLQTLSLHSQVSTVVLVLPEAEVVTQNTWHQYVDQAAAFLVVAGGSDRRESTLAGLLAWQAHPNYHAEAPVMIHDGARPFVTTTLIDQGLAGLSQHKAVIPALPVTDTLKWVASGNLNEGPDRSALAAVQTPQVFQSTAIIDAHNAVEAQKPQRAFTDDASIYEWFGGTCGSVAGDPDNLKITTVEDWDRAKAILASRRGKKDKTMWEPRSGIGYDVHRLVPGDGVWLCGHFIAHTHRLDGHSDADVGLHALTDALLGAIGAGDIGTHFPPTDPQWKGVESHIFLAHAAKLIAERGGKIANVDVAIVAEEPKIGPHREAMTARMADILGIDSARISVKATTNERMGFAGRKEGIGALATAMVLVPSDD